MAPHLHIIASCTDRKRGEIPDGLRLREIPPDEAPTRAAAWWRRLDAAMPLLRTEAAKVYVGEHWNLVQDVANHVRSAGWTTELWIASAGYGLLSERSLINPYSSTFSDESPDCVAVGLTGAERLAYHQAWWSSLAELRDDREGPPASLASLAARQPDALMLVLGSPDYVRAMQADLSSASTRLTRPEQISIITSDAGWSAGPLADNVVVADSRTRAAWGGTMQGLHARTALNLVREPGMLHKPFSARDLHATYQAMVGETQKPEKLNRARMSDEEVVEFLRAELAKTPTAGWTLLLRVLRNSGRACEQRRFRQLHAEIAAATRGEPAAS